MALADTLEEQALLEEILDDSKPAVPNDCRELHYLLFTPFRYGALYPKGSRFRRAGLTRGVFYASQSTALAVSEMAFHRLLFYAESPATPWPSTAGEYTVFSVKFATGKSLDLTRPPLARDASKWTSPVDYSHCQALADAAREANIDVLRYRSARADGQNVALLSCRAFAAHKPVDRQVWRMQVGSVGVRALCSAPPQRLAFGREAFARDPRIAALTWDR
jgi:hypothetical protein